MADDQSRAATRRFVLIAASVTAWLLWSVFVVEVIVAFVTASAGLWTDAFHNSADAVTASIVVRVLRTGSERAKRRMVRINILVVVATGALGAGYALLEALGYEHPQNGGLVIVTACGSGLANLAAGVLCHVAGRRARTVLLATDADLLSSHSDHWYADAIVCVFVVVGGVGILCGAPSLDWIMGAAAAVWCAAFAIVMDRRDQRRHAIA